MAEAIVAVPFTAASDRIEGSSYSETTYRGLLRIEDDALVLEYRETVMEVSGVGYTERTREGVTEIRIPAETIGTLEVRNRFLRGPVLDIDLIRMGPADAVPWSKDARIRVKIPRTERGRARDLATDFRLLQADTRLKELGEGDLTG